MDLELMKAGSQVLVFGLGGVFSVLILFYFTTKIMLRISTKFNAKKTQDKEAS